MLYVTISHARAIVEELNRDLQAKCGSNMKLILKLYRNKHKDDAVYDENATAHWMVCLYTENRCISTIVCKISPATKSFEISSKTEKEYEGRKYNVYLRAAVLLLAPYIKYRLPNRRNSSLHNMISRPVNNISTLLMIRNFNAQNPQVAAFLEEYGKKSSEITMDDIMKLYDELEPNVNLDKMDEETAAEWMKNHTEFGTPLELMVPVSRETANHYKHMVDESLAKLVCIVGGSKTRMKKTRIKTNNKMKKTQKIK